MDKQSLEYYISNAWDTAKNVAMEVTKKPIKKIGLALAGFALYNSVDNNASFAQTKVLVSTANYSSISEVTSIIDSITISYGHSGENRGPHGITKSLWESKNGVPTLKDTVDFGVLPAGSGVPSLTNGSGFGVNYTSAKWDTIFVKGRIVREEDRTPLENAGVNIFNAKGGEFLGGDNYLENSDDLVTNVEGKFSMPLRIMVQEEINDSSIIVISPNKGEDLEPGATQEIIWDNSYGGTLFDVFYSQNKGRDWEFINIGYLPTGDGSSKKKLDWTVPKIASGTCMVKVVDKKSPGIYDSSDSLFTIGTLVDSIATVISPNGGEIYLGGSTQEIAVGSNYDGTDFEVFLSFDGGELEYIGNANEPKEGDSSVRILNWKFPNEAYTDIVVKAQDAQNSNVSDVSDGAFSIDIDTEINSEYINDEVPKEFAVSQNFPNPSNPETKIQYKLPKSASNVKITIYDALCREG